VKESGLSQARAKPLADSRGLRRSAADCPSIFSHLPEPDITRVSSADGTYQTAPTNYATNFSYAPHGALTAIQLGNGLLESTNFNNRLQPTQIQAGGLLTLDFQYHPAAQPTKNNGNIHEQKITATGLPGGFLTQTYTYDDLNRLGSITEGAWSRTYGFDRYGNRWVSGTTGHTLHSSTPTASTDFAAATNRLLKNAATFDNGGNLLSETFLGSMAYDADNHQTTFTDPVTSAVSTYTYDGDGNRVRKVTPSETTVYVYDAFGKLAAEYASAAPSGPVGTQYRTTDHLGSTRLVTNTTQGVISRRDFFPFGEEIPASATFGGRDQVAGYNQPSGYRQQFTDKERDTESGMDYFLARYYSSPMGRFLSVDPENAGAEPSDPQAWNAYAYTRSNPLKYVDPTGEYFVVARRGRKQVQRFISTMLRTPQGRATINAIATSPKPVSFSRGRLPSVKNPSGSLSIDAGAAKLITGNTPGAIGGVDVTLDKSNIKTIANATGQSEFTTGLNAFAHETQHVTDMLSAPNSVAATIAGAAGDASTSPGANNTTGGTAESRAQQIVGASGAAGQSFQPNAQFDAAAAGIIKRGAAQQEAAEQAKQTATCLAATPGGPCP
jgi:RHS repeat-associated protein